MLLKKTINKITLDKILNMRILKKKTLGIFEVYLIFLSCLYAGFIGYKSLLNICFYLN